MVSILKTTKVILITILIIFSSKFIHWYSANLTVIYCQKSGWAGFFESFLTSQSPFCMVLDKIYSVSGNIYSIVIMSIITSLIPISSAVLGYLYKGINISKEQNGNEE